MKTALLLLYALAKGLCAVASVDDAVARTAAAAAWIRGGPPPRHWTVSREADAPVGAPLEQGAIKRAFVVPHRSDLLIKTVKPRRHGRRPARTEAHTLAEILYLEFLRGRRGVPALHGGWMANGTVFYVVQRVGAALANRTSEGFLHPSAPWVERCRSRPLGAAIALLACVRSFADAGYADLDHSLDGRQLTLADDGDVYLIDAPEPLPTSPVSDVVEWALRGTYQPRPTGAGKCAMDTDCPGAIHDADRGRCAKRDCTPGFEQGANETKGWCRAARCAPVTARTLAFDLATRTWALPLILAEGRFPSAGTKRAFGDLIDTMRRAAPENRPSFAEALSVVSDVEEPGPPEPVSLTDAAVARAAAAAAWFRGAPPPRHWTLTASLAARPQPNFGRGRLQEGACGHEPGGADREDAQARGAPGSGPWTTAASAPCAPRCFTSRSPAGAAACPRCTAAGSIGNGCTTSCSGRARRWCSTGPTVVHRNSGYSGAETRPSRRRGRSSSASGRLRIRATSWGTCTARSSH